MVVVSLDRTVLAFAMGLAFAAAACGHDWEQFDPRVTGGAAAAGAGASGGGGGAGAAGPGGGGGAGAASTGGAGAGGTGGSGVGGTGGVLSDEGLLARYYLDEAAAGTAPTAAIDAAPNPLALPIEWVGGMAYTSEQGHQGIHWTTPGQNGSPHLAVIDTKIMDLSGQSSGTIEAVVRAEEASVYGSRLVHVGFESGWSFSLAVSLEQVVPEITTGPPTRFVGEGVTLSGAGFDARWPYRFDPSARMVVHLVFDSMQDDESQRLKLFVDGTLVTPVDDVVYPLPGDTLLLAGNESVAVGNRAIGGRSVLGTLFYGAYYTIPLSEETIAEHVAVLVADDDSP